ncbi:MAG: AEC family transporter [Hyphomicrobiaceae bacterium]
MDALINVAVPVFGIVLTGYLAGHFGVLGPDSAAALNRFVYYFALPPVLFVFTARAPIEKILNWPFMAAFVGGSLGTLLISVVVGRLWFGHNVSVLAVQGLTAVFSNTAYMGIPLFLTAFGPDGALPAIVATLVASTLLIGGTIAALEAERAVGPSAAQVVLQVGGTLARNPLMIAPFLGVGFSVLAVPVPKPIGNYLDLLAAAAGPAALFALGLSLVGRRLAGARGEVTWVVFLKLAVHPILTYGLAMHVFAMDPRWSQAAVILAALPVGALVFVIAQQYEVYVQRASAAVIASTVLSVATISLLLIWFRLG